MDHAGLIRGIRSRLLPCPSTQNTEAVRKRKAQETSDTTPCGDDSRLPSDVLHEGDVHGFIPWEFPPVLSPFLYRGDVSAREPQLGSSMVSCLSLCFQFGPAAAVRADDGGTGQSEACRRLLDSRKGLVDISRRHSPNVYRNGASPVFPRISKPRLGLGELHALSRALSLRVSARNKWQDTRQHSTDQDLFAAPGNPSFRGDGRSANMGDWMGDEPHGPRVQRADGLCLGVCGVGIRQAVFELARALLPISQ